ncbi:uncharacterized protein LOC142294999 isoform X2 [Anomaloglossus baeobatrachus]
MLGFGKSVILIVIVFLTLLVDTFTTLFAIFNWAKTKNDKDIVENFFHKLGSSIYVIVAIFIVTVILNIIGFGLCFYIWRTRNAQKKETDELEEVIVHKPASRSDQKLDSPIESTVFAPTDISVPASTTCQSTENGQKEENDELVEVIVHKPASRSDQKLDSPIENKVVAPTEISVPASTTCQSPVKLTPSQRAILESDEWLDDDIIDTAQEILKRQFEADGLQSCAVAQLGYQPVSGPSVQIHYDEDRRHWFTSCFRDGRILIADSMNSSLSRSGKRQILELYSQVARNPLRNVTFLNVDRQPNKYDCGVYCIANAYELLTKNGNVICKYINREMRTHLIHCLEKGFFSPFSKVA